MDPEGCRSASTPSGGGASGASPRMRQGASPLAPPGLLPLLRQVGLERLHTLGLRLLQTRKVTSPLRRAAGLLLALWLSTKSERCVGAPRDARAPGAQPVLALSSRPALGAARLQTKIAASCSQRACTSIWTPRQPGPCRRLLRRPLACSPQCAPLRPVCNVQLKLPVSRCSPTAGLLTSTSSGEA